MNHAITNLRTLPLALSDPANLPPDDLLRDRLKTLAWLISAGRLDIRLAVGAQGGLFHLKIGLFTDNDGNCVAFTAFAAELLRPYLGARQPPGAAGLEVHEPAAPYLAPPEQAAEGCRAPRPPHLWPHQVAA